MKRAIKIDKIKTLDEAFEVGDIWLNRALKLADIWQDDGRDGRDQLRAFYLWGVLSKRMIKLNSAISEFRSKGYKLSGKYPSGCVTFNKKS